MFLELQKIVVALTLFFLVQLKKLRKAFFDMFNFYNIHMKHKQWSCIKNVKRTCNQLFISLQHEKCSRDNDTK
jgi:hypothetical protein